MYYVIIAGTFILGAIFFVKAREMYRLSNGQREGMEKGLCSITAIQTGFNHNDVEVALPGTDFMRYAVEILEPEEIRGQSVSQLYEITRKPGYRPGDRVSMNYLPVDGNKNAVPEKVQLPERGWDESSSRLLAVILFAFALFYIAISVATLI